MAADQKYKLTEVIVLPAYECESFLHGLGELCRVHSATLLGGKTEELDLTEET